MTKMPFFISLPRFPPVPTHLLTFFMLNHEAEQTPAFLLSEERGSGGWDSLNHLAAH